MSDLDLYADGRAIGADQLEAYQVQLELVHRELVGFELFGEDVTVSLRCVRGAISELQLAQDGGSHTTGYRLYIQAQTEDQDSTYLEIS